MLVFDWQERSAHLSVSPREILPLSMDIHVNFLQAIFAIIDCKIARNKH